MKLPSNLKKYFWDADVERMDKRSVHYITERIMEEGDIRAIRWLMAHVDRACLREVLIRSRSLSPESASFWAHILGVPTNKILCLQKQFRERRSKLWSW